VQFALTVPCVLDRFVPQAGLQVLQKRWDPTFSEPSHGFRPGRSARQAVNEAQPYIAEGYRGVVDLDLEKFFDRVNHDRLLAAVAERVADKRMLKLIRAFLEGHGAFGLIHLELETVRDEVCNALHHSDADPHVRWCGRGGEVTLPPMPIPGQVSTTNNSHVILAPKVAPASCRLSRGRPALASSHSHPFVAFDFSLYVLCSRSFCALTPTTNDGRPPTDILIHPP
jgi:hypothetical protein